MNNPSDTALANFYKKTRKTIGRIRLSDNIFDIVTYQGLVKFYNEQKTK